MIIEPCGVYANAQINQQEYDIRKELHPGAQLGAKQIPSLVTVFFQPTTEVKHACRKDTEGYTGTRGYHHGINARFEK